MAKLNIIVTGANGQLGMELREISIASPYQYTFLSSSDLDISTRSNVKDFFDNHQVDVVINCAAYTKVDLAESEKTKAYDVNANGVKNLLDHMPDECIMIHYSTDYVYQSKMGIPIHENEVTKPTNVYAASKLAGDKLILESNQKALILRTSWVYSSYGNNFVKTMLKLADKLPELNVVNDQIGSPTYAKDLAEATLSILDYLVNSVDSDCYNKVYHYSNRGQISWYDFAKEIFNQKNKTIPLKGIPTSQYPTPASRPSWSVLECNLVQETFNIKTRDWKKSLASCLDKLS